MTGFNVPLARAHNAAGNRTSDLSAVIIGAGTSGIAAAHELDLQGIEYRIVEASTEMGGVWSKSMHPTAYPGLLQNTAPNLTVYEHSALHLMPLGTHFTREEYAAYLLDFVRHRDIERWVMFGTRATAIALDRASLLVDVVSTSGDWHRQIGARHVIYAGGLHHCARKPEIRGISSFIGDVCHSGDIGRISLYRNKRILLIGIGNTCADLAVQLRKQEDVDVHVSCRASVWIVPREIESMPIDAYCQWLRQCWPDGWQSRFRSACVAHGAVYFGDAECGEHIDFSCARITVNTELLTELAAGRVTVHGRVACANEDSVFFESGHHARFDALVFCTGYDYRPIKNAQSRYPLIGNIRHAEHPIWYLGAPAVWGGSPRVAQYQARLVAHSIRQGWSAADLDAAIKRSPFSGYKRASSTVGPGFEVVDFFDYQNLINDLCRSDRSSQ